MSKIPHRSRQLTRSIAEPPKIADKAGESSQSPPKQLQLNTLGDGQNQQFWFLQIAMKLDDLVFEINSLIGGGNVDYGGFTTDDFAELHGHLLASGEKLWTAAKAQFEVVPELLKNIDIDPSKID